MGDSAHTAQQQQGQTITDIDEENDEQQGFTNLQPPLIISNASQITQLTRGPKNAKIPGGSRKRKRKSRRKSRKSKRKKRRRTSKQLGRRRKYLTKKAKCVTLKSGSWAKKAKVCRKNPLCYWCDQHDMCKAKKRY